MQPWPNCKRSLPLFSFVLVTDVLSDSMTEFYESAKVAGTGMPFASLEYSRIHAHTRTHALVYMLSRFREHQHTWPVDAIYRATLQSKCGKN